MKNVFLTVFTPTYNRGYVLPRLYQSLCRQTDKDFEWIIVDDGSVDDTSDLVKGWMRENQVNIKYFYQENSGKPQAHNIGVKKSVAELFVCVDSDDLLTDDAVKKVKTFWEAEQNNADIIGMVLKRGGIQGEKITSWAQGLLKETFFRAQKLYSLAGDTMLVWRTDILKKVEFPVFANEKFIPEGYLYDKLSNFGKCIFIDEVLYLCEYLPDGYTASMSKVNARNPLGYQAYIKQRLKMDFTFKDKWLDSIRYVAIKLVNKDGRLFKDTVYPLWTILAYLPGHVLYWKRYKKYC